MLNNASANTRRPIANASQSSLNRAFSAIDSDAFTAISDMRHPPKLLRLRNGRAGISVAVIEKENLRANPFNMAAKSRRRQSHRILLLAGFGQQPSPEKRPERRNARLRRMAAPADPD